MSRGHSSDHAPRPGHPASDGSTHNSLMRMSGTQMLSVGMDSLVMLSKSPGSHWRNSSVQYWGRSRHGHGRPAPTRAGSAELRLSPPAQCPGYRRASSRNLGVGGTDPSAAPGGPHLCPHTLPTCMHRQGQPLWDGIHTSLRTEGLRQTAACALVCPRVGGADVGPQGRWPL